MTGGKVKQKGLNKGLALVKAGQCLERKCSLGSTIHHPQICGFWALCVQPLVVQLRAEKVDCPWDCSGLLFPLSCIAGGGVPEK